MAAAMDEFVEVPDSSDDQEEPTAEASRGEAERGEEVGKTSKLHRHFMRVRFEGSVPGDSLSLQLAVLQSLRTLYGQAGAADAVEVLQYELKSREALLSMSSQASTRVRNALTVLTEWEHAPMRAHVVQSTQGHEPPTLAALSTRNLR